MPPTTAPSPFVMVDRSKDVGLAWHPAKVTISPAVAAQTKQVRAIAPLVRCDHRPMSMKVAPPERKHNNERSGPRSDRSSCGDSRPCALGSDGDRRDQAAPRGVDYYSILNLRELLARTDGE